MLEDLNCIRPSMDPLNFTENRQQESLSHQRILQGPHKESFFRMRRSRKHKA